MMHLWIPSCFNSNVTPLWILCLTLFSVLRIGLPAPHCSKNERWYTATWCPSQTFCEAFSGFPAPSSDHGLWGSLITIGAAKAEPVSKLPSAEIKSERIQENWLFFAFARQMWKWLDSKWEINTWDDYGCMNRKFVIVARDGRFLPIKSNCIYCLSFLVV